MRWLPHKPKALARALLLFSSLSFRLVKFPQCHLNLSWSPVFLRAYFFHVISEVVVCPDGSICITGVKGIRGLIYCERNESNTTVYCHFLEPKIKHLRSVIDDTILSWVCHALKPTKRRARLRLRYPAAKSSPYRSIEQVTKEAIELADQQKVREAIIKLTEYPTKLYGVAVRVASAIRTFYNPEHYAVLDIHSWRALYNEKLTEDKQTPEGYEKYLKDVRGIADRYKMTAHESRRCIMGYWRRNTFSTN